MSCPVIQKVVRRFESGSDDCAAFQCELETVCCTPKAWNPCNLCPYGVTFDGEFEFDGVTMSCYDIASVAMGFESESDECATLPSEDMKAVCCPPDPENPRPCELCPDGFTYDGELEFEGLTITCSEIALVVMGWDLERHKDMEAVCCPPKDSISTASPESSTEAALGGVSFSGFGGFVLVSVVLSAWAVGSV
jgi:hypothetical protein